MPEASLNPQNRLVSSASQPSPKYNDFEGELKQVHTYLSNHIATATMAAVELNIYRPNLCRHVAELRKRGLIAVVSKSKCRITGFTAEFLTCNAEIMERLKR